MAFDREELLLKLTKAVARNPSITMTDLAKTTAISKASLHRIYSTKENLLEIILLRTREFYSGISVLLTKKHEDFMGDLKELIATFCDNSAYILFINRDIFTDRIESDDWVRHDKEMEDFFSEGQRQGIFSKEFGADVMANIFLGIVTWLLAMKLEKNNISEQDLRETILATVLSGIGEKTSLK